NPFVGLRRHSKSGCSAPAAGSLVRGNRSAGRKFHRRRPVSRSRSPSRMSPDPLPADDATLHALVHSIEEARQPLLRLAQGLAREAVCKADVLACELAELTGAGYTAVYRFEDDGSPVLSAAHGVEEAAAEDLARRAPAADGGGVAVPLTADGICLGAIVALRAGGPFRIDEELVAAVAELAASVLAADERIAESRAEARRDAVTGLGNRRAFDERSAAALDA